MFSVKWKLSRHTGGGNPSQCHQMTHGGGGGSKIGKKSVTYNLNGPFRTKNACVKCWWNWPLVQLLLDPKEMVFFVEGLEKVLLKICSLNADEIDIIWYHRQRCLTWHSLQMGI